MRVLRHLFAHVVIAVFDAHFDIAIARQAFADLAGDVHHLALARFKPLALEVAQDIVHFGALYAALDAAEVVKTLIAFGGLRRFVRRQRLMNAGGQRQRVDHHALGAAGVHAVAEDFDRHRGGVEVLALQLADPAAVHGISPFGIEGRHVEQLRPLAYLLVRGEGYADVAMRDFARAQAHHGGEDLGDAGLVVGAQQRFAVGGDQGLPQHLVQDREHHRRQHFIADAERDVASAIVLDDLRIDVFAAEIRRGIQMGDKTDRRHRPGDVARPGAHHAAVFAERHPLEAERDHFLLQRTRQLQLPVGARHMLYVRFGLGVERDVVEKAVK
ncbi:Uncharacterised protein [Serratia marcescens]|nr:Uncharacterised protein [Serratia marcescens]